MNSTGAFSSKPSVQSEKILRSAGNNQHSSGKALQTPEKPANPPRRRQSLRSVKQIREAVKQLQNPDLKASVPSDPVTSSGASTEIRIAKPNASKSLPEKYEMLYKFFHSLGSSLRLLRLKGSASTFTNISKQVQILTDRSFAYSHLAQLKFIMPDVIEIKKILVRDDRTSCLKPELHITLNLSVVQNDEKLNSDSAYLLIAKLFRSRLVKFCKSNPEGDEVPKENLPEPFNQSTRSYSNPIQKPDHLSVQDPIAASHMPQSFKRRFSKQVPIHNVETVKHESNALTSETQADHVSDVKSPLYWSTKLPETPIKDFDLSKSVSVSTPFTSTPVQLTRPSVRCFMTPDDESTMSPSKLTKRSTLIRSMTFDTPMKNKPPPVKRVFTNDDDDLSDILSQDLLASIKEHELKTLEENTPEITQAKWRKQMISRLPKLFDTILFYFQSTKRMVITKPELVNMIVTSQLEIVDPREVDEQLRLLQEFAPEWVYEKVASSGDILFCVKKISSPESIRARLLEAN